MKKLPKKSAEAGKIIPFVPKKHRTEQKRARLAEVRALEPIRRELESTKKQIDNFYFELNTNPTMKTVIELNLLLDDIQKPVKRILKNELIAIIKTVLKYRPQNDLQKAYFKFLEDHLKKLEKM